LELYSFRETEWWKNGMMEYCRVQTAIGCSVDIRDESGCPLPLLKFVPRLYSKQR
jgi:hypothetical protein